MNVIEVTTFGQRSPVVLINGQLITFVDQDEYVKFKLAMQRDGIKIVRWQCSEAQRRLIEPHYVPAENVTTNEV